MKILIAPDKFKETFSASEITKIIETGINEFDKNIQTILFPLADGGEGTAEILGKITKSTKINVFVSDPLFRKIKASYYLTPDKKTAFIEMSAASGIKLLKKSEQNPCLTSSYGTGEIIYDAYKKGAKKIILGIGGSATNDAGIGAASALNFKFYDKNNKILKPTGKNLSEINYIDNSCVKINFNEIEIVTACDVDNFLFGKNGAAYVYAKQKGAKQKDIKSLDFGLQNFAQVIKKQFNKNISEINGTGAAGGFGAGSIAFFNAELKSGTDTVFQYSDFDNILKNVDFVITGEGKIDKQTLSGKVVKGVFDKAEKYKIPAAAICGLLNISKSEFQNKMITDIKFLFKNEVLISEAKEKSFNLIKEKTKEILISLQKKFRKI